MTDVTARLALPLLQPGQAQKELYHNEALAAIDIAIQPNVNGAPVNTPPADPSVGDCWIVGPAPTGQWADRKDALAGWTAGGWRFCPAKEGATVWNIAAGTSLQYLGGSWQETVLHGSAVSIGGVRVVGPRQPAIASPTGGSTIDAQARTAIGQLVAALQAHGLISP